MVGGDGKDPKIKKTEALPSRGLESRKISQNRPAGRSHIHTFREGSVCGGWGETTQLKGFGRGSGGKISAGRGWVKGIPRKGNLKLQRWVSTEHILGNSISGLTVTLYTCRGIMMVACWLVKTQTEHMFVY